jgi:type IV secretion system protein VirD4
MRAMKNYAGHRLSPWLGHLMVSRTETARPLLTPGEVMQLPPDEEIVMAAGLAPIRGRKARYYQDARFASRLLPPPTCRPLVPAERPQDDWTCLASLDPPAQIPAAKPTADQPAIVEPASQSPSPAGEVEDADATSGDPANAGIRREPDMPEHEEIVARPEPVPNEFDFGEGDEDAEAARNRRLQERMKGAARQASLDPDDGIAL